MTNARKSTMPKNPARPRLRRKGRVRELFNLLVFFVGVYTLLELTIPRSVVQSISMQPTLIENQRLVVSRLSYMLGEPHRGDIVVFEAPEAQPEDTALIKRLIGLPGEKIEFRHQSVYINGVVLQEPYINEPCEPASCQDDSWELGPDEFFMMGDNRNHSRDSRSFGPVNRHELVGRAVLRWWPPAVWSLLTYNYDGNAAP